jgi:hypothetical protein
VFESLRLPFELTTQRSLLLLRLLNPPPPAPFASVRADYETNRIANQLEYYERQAKWAASRQRWLKAVALTFTAIATAGSVAGLAGMLDSNWEWYQWLRFTIQVLPLVSAALLSAIAALDLGRRAARYREQAEYLRTAQARVRWAPNWDHLTRIVLEVERTLLLEIWEWFSLARFAARK